jgi:hypothetical protein
VEEAFLFLFPAVAAGEEAHLVPVICRLAAWSMG